MDGEEPVDVREAVGQQGGGERGLAGEGASWWDWHTVGSAPREAMVGVSRGAICSNAHF